ncbi:MAG TPA: hypothetical protein VK208_01360 [Pyrinomonadaceae bacterium]|jgi:hypothetical protein|nr:hypothetical protein [Pyrinomonadaceae bacterium]
MSKPITFSIPYVTELEQEAGWERLPGAHHMYRVIRCHYWLRDRQVKPACTGEVVDALSSVAGIKEKYTDTVEVEHTTQRCDQAVWESLRTEESMLKFASELSAGIGSDALGKLGANVKNEAQVTLQNSFRNTFQVQVSEGFREKRTTTKEYSIDPRKFRKDEKVVLATAYNRRAYDLYLLFVDYLTIKYERPPWALKQKRSKLPEIVGGKHLNVVRCDLPLSTILFWQQLPNTVLPFYETDYKLEVEDPFEIQVENYSGGRTPYVPPNVKPTLYEISNKPFPLKRW